MNSKPLLYTALDYFIMLTCLVILAGLLVVANKEFSIYQGCMAENHFEALGEIFYCAPANEKQPVLMPRDIVRKQSQHA